jgi:flagellar protein FliL
MEVPMSNPDTVAAESKPRRALVPVILGLILALAFGGAGFYATHSGLIGGSAPTGQAQAPVDLPDIAFVPIEPVTISLPESQGQRHLRFTAQIEVAQPHAGDVQALMPRIVDVLNGYLRAVEPASLQQVGALARVRAQLLRRIQIVTGEGRVRDLLVTEFVFG